MKKILALSMALIMIFSVMSVSIISASAEELTKSLTSSEIEIARVKGGATVTYGTASDDFLAKIPMTLKDQNYYIKIPSSVWDLNPTKLEYTFKADGTWMSRGNVNYFSTVNSAEKYTSSADVNAIETACSIGGWLNITDAGLTRTYDLTSDTYAKVKEEKMNYLILSPYAHSTFTATNLYVVSIKVYYEGVAETDGETTDAIATADKASIRLNEVNGIRFSTTVDTDKLAALGTVTEIGTLIGPKNIIGDYLTMDDVTAKNAVAVEYGVDNDLWEGNKFVGSIVNVQDYNLNREFVARGYVKVGDTYYYSSTTSTRTLAGVADSFIADTANYSKLDADTQALVNTWAAAND